MAAPTKDELVEELASQVTKDDLVKLLGSKLKKDELVSVVEGDGDATKDELVRKLGSRTKDDLVQALAGHSTKDELQKLIDSQARRQQERRQQQPERDSDDDLDWSAELDWAPPPRPTPAPVAFAGAAPFLPGQRVRVDLAGLPTMGVFAGKGASAAGTIVGVNARERSVRVYLDAIFAGAKEIVLPPERITPDG